MQDTGPSFQKSVLGFVRNCNKLRTNLCFSPTHWIPSILSQNEQMLKSPLLFLWLLLFYLCPLTAPPSALGLFRGTGKEDKGQVLTTGDLGVSQFTTTIFW